MRTDKQQTRRRELREIISTKASEIADLATILEDVNEHGQSDYCGLETVCSVIEGHTEAIRAAINARYKNGCSTSTKGLIPV